MEIHVSVAPETLWSVDLPLLGTLNITNSFLTMILVMAFLIIAGALIARSASLIPNKIQSVFEMAVEFLLGLVESTAGKTTGRRIFPLIGGLFIFIIISNYAGLLPGIGTIGREPAQDEEHAVVMTQASVGSDGAFVVDGIAAAQEGDEEHASLIPYFRSPSADLNMTLAMSILAFTVVQIAGVAAHGVGGRIKHMANPPFLFPIEVISEFSRIISLSFRLFGNIFAGEVLVTVMVTLANAIKITVIGLLVPVVFLYLEVLFGFIQALVFSLLTLIYIVLATATHDDAHGHEEEPAEVEGEHFDHSRAHAASGGD